MVRNTGEVSKPQCFQWGFWDEGERSDPCKRALGTLTWIKTDMLGQPVLVETGRVDCDLAGLLRYCIHPTQT